MTKRYEYKYAVEGRTLSSIIETIIFHPAGFSEAYPQRKVNNFYLDTTDLEFFYLNIDGIANRRKFRYRWYGDLQNCRSAQLETKNKTNELGWKETLKLDAASIRNKKSLSSHFQSLGLSEAVLSPTLYNSYLRNYYESFDGLFRITIDFDQQFGRPFHMGAPYQVIAQDPNIIVELKFDEQHANRLNDVSQHLPFIRTKNSKYSNGICLL